MIQSNIRPFFDNIDGANEVLSTRMDLMKTFFTVVIALAAIFRCSPPVFGQAGCLSDAEIKKMLVQVNSPRNGSFNKKLRDELLKLREKDQKRFQNAVGNNEKPEALLKRISAIRERNTA